MRIAEVGDLGQCDFRPFGPWSKYGVHILAQLPGPKRHFPLPEPEGDEGKDDEKAGNVLWSRTLVGLMPRLRISAVALWPSGNLASLAMPRTSLRALPASPRG